MKNELEDLLNSVFGSRRAGSGASAGGSLPELHADKIARTAPDTAAAGAASAAAVANAPAAAATNTPAAGVTPAAAVAPVAATPAAAAPTAVTVAATPVATAPTAVTVAATPATATPTAVTVVTAPAVPTPSAPKPSAQSAPKPTATTAPSAAAATPLQATETLQQNVLQMNDVLNARLSEQKKEIDALSQTARDDIARIQREVGTPAVQNLANTGAAVVQPGSAGAGAEAFDGLAAALSKTVLGQADYLQKLVIAFKRPYVMGHSGESARNTILLTGTPCTGRHLSLAEITAQLNTRGVLATGDIAVVDLGLYPTPSEEKLFLQDLYMALSTNAEIVTFTRYESCHSGFLSVLSALVQQGKSPLANRYVLQNGRLIDVGTALVQDAISELTPHGKYLVFVTERPVAKLADSFGAPFVSALGDVCETARLTPQALAAIASTEFAKLQARAKASLKLDLTANDVTLALAAAAADGSSGAQGLLAFWDKTYRALAQYKLEHDEPLTAAALSAENDAPAVRFDGGKAVALFTLLPADYTGAMEEVKAELDGIVGLTEIKKYILSLEDNFKVQARRKEKGLKTASVSMHMLFTGSPGTGKTTIARLVSKYLKAIGVLSGGQLVEVTRADLVGKYVGHTAPLTTQVIRSAIGGVLFIDEAYSLYRGKDDSFGLEAIDTLVKGMEDSRDNLIVILAGYSKEMAEFLTANSGLKSRFPNMIEFPDYTGEELLAITKLQVKGKGYTLDSACDSVLLTYYNAVQLSHARDAGNGRLARNKVEDAILNQSKRLMQLANEPNADLSLLTTQDFTLDDIDTMG